MNLQKIPNAILRAFSENQENYTLDECLKVIDFLWELDFKRFFQNTNRMLLRKDVVDCVLRNKKDGFLTFCIRPDVNISVIQETVRSLTASRLQNELLIFEEVNTLFTEDEFKIFCEKLISIHQGVQVTQFQWYDVLPVNYLNTFRGYTQVAVIEDMFIYLKNKNVADVAEFLNTLMDDITVCEKLVVNLVCEYETSLSTLVDIDDCAYLPNDLYVALVGVSKNPESVAMLVNKLGPEKIVDFLFVAESADELFNNWKSSDKYHTELQQIYTEIRTRARTGKLDMYSPNNDTLITWGAFSIWDVPVPHRPFSQESSSMLVQAVLNNELTASVTQLLTQDTFMSTSATLGEVLQAAKAALDSK